MCLSEAPRACLNNLGQCPEHEHAVCLKTWPSPFLSLPPTQHLHSISFMADQRLYKALLCRRHWGLPTHHSPAVYERGSLV